MSELKLKLTNQLSSAWNNSYLIDIGNGNKIVVNSSSFGNCQNFTIGYFSDLITQLEVQYIKTDLKEVISAIKEFCGIRKPLLILDLNKSVYESIKNKLKIISKMNYESSNTSKMVILVVDTRKL